MIVSIASRMAASSRNLDGIGLWGTERERRQREEKKTAVMSGETLAAAEKRRPDWCERRRWNGGVDCEFLPPCALLSFCLRSFEWRRSI